MGGSERRHHFAHQVAGQERLGTASQGEGREITEIAVSRGLLTSTGKTPEATMSARFYASATDQ